MYDRLVDTDLDVHLYGTADELPPDDFRGIVHVGETTDFRRGWFVVFDPAGASADPIALGACEVEPRTWHGFWTYGPVRVQRTERYVECTL